MARTPLAEYLVLDIETVPDSERWQRPAPEPHVSAPAPPPVENGIPHPSEAPPEQPPREAKARPETDVEAPLPPVPAASPGSAGARSAAEGRRGVWIDDVPPPTAPPAGRRERRGGERSERGDAPGFPPTWAHRIITIGCLWLDHAYRLKKIDTIRAPASDSADVRERGLLERLSRFIGKSRPILVTYNGRSFDLPVIALRSLCHAVPIGWYYRDTRVRYRYTEEGHLDLCDWLADHGAVRAGKLDALARLVGLPGKIGVDGSQVEGLFLDGKLDAIETYCLADVAQTAFLFLRFRLLQGRITPDAYRDRVTSLLDALAADGRLGDVIGAIDRAQLLGPPQGVAVAESSA